MNEQDLNRKVEHAFSAIAPDSLPQEILSACTEQKGVLKMKKNLVLKRTLAVAAAFLLVLTGLIGVWQVSLQNAVASTVSLDVNPSVEIKVNQKEKVLEVVPRNEEAKTIIGTMDFKGSSLEVTVNALIGSMLQKGFITELSNSILISVDNKDAAEATRLQEKLTAKVEGMLHTESFDGAVLSQTVTTDNELKNQAEANNISTGKAQLINRIIELNPQRTFEELAPLTIHQLNLLAESLQPQAVTATGEASQKGYIGKEKAKEIALNHAGVTEPLGLEIELDYELFKMCYELEFYANGYEYEYDVDASTGEVVKHRKETEGNPTPDSGTGTAGSITGEQAKAAALNHAGVSESEIRGYEMEFDRDGGRQVYEIEFKAGGMEYQYEIDAVTGTVLESEKEYDD